jgi:hypothetical protein
MRKGDEVWDVSAGIAPRMRDLMRVYVYGREPDFLNNWGKVATGAVIRPLSPLVRKTGEGVSFASQKMGGIKDPKNPFQGWVFEDKDIEWQSWAPLVFQATKEAY